MEGKRKIKGKAFLKDFRAGMTEDLLMAKYLLSPADLQRVLEHLTSAGILVETEVTVPGSEKRDLHKEVRRHRRCYPTFVIPVYDLGDLLAEGELHDINEKGMRASGIDTQPGAEKELIIQADSVADIFPFCIKAVCRWSEVDPDGKTMSGFEITSWPPVGSEELRKILDTLSLCDQG